MKKEHLTGIFLALICVQIIVPVSMITKRESTLKHGIPFKFRTAPVDPYDAFRGRYVALSVETNKVTAPKGVLLKYGQPVYAQLITDENGWAQVSVISLKRPRHSAYLLANVTTHMPGQNVGINLPIDRYYMNESAAPRAEQLYREHSRSDKQDAHVVVRVKDGFGVIEGLYIGNQAIEELVKRMESRTVSP